MSDDQPVLPLAPYRLLFRAEDDLRLPAQPGSLWHGVFGLHLRELCCLAPGTECSACLLLHQCQYSALFSGPLPPESELMRRYATIPVPHIFQLDPAHRESIQAGDPLGVMIVLIGIANQRLPLVVQSLAAAGQQGLGANRARLWLKDVIQIGPDGSAYPVGSNGKLGEPLPPEHPGVPPVPRAVRLRFLSPYKASGDGAKTRGLDLSAFLMAIVRRCSLLQYFYTGRQLGAPFAALKEAAAGAGVIARDLHEESASRYSARHGQRVPTGGLTGSLDLDMTGIESLWPYLHLGQWLNVGKNASMGYGQYELYRLAE